MGGGGWPARVDETGLALTAEYSAPSAGPPPVTGVLRNKLGLGTAEELAAAEREITHAALILIRAA